MARPTSKLERRLSNKNRLRRLYYSNGHDKRNSKVTFLIRKEEDLENSQDCYYDYEFYRSAPIPEPIAATEQFTPLGDYGTVGTFCTPGTSTTSGWIDRFGNTVSTSTGAYCNYNSVKAIAGESTSTDWWLRSAYRQSTEDFCFAFSWGFISSDLSNCSYGVSFCFCV